MLIKYRLEYANQEDIRWLTRNPVLVCFGISWIIGGDMYYDILSEESHPIIVNTQYCDIIEGSIPSNWCFSKTERGFFIDPQEFTGKFWEKYHDGDSDAEETFKEVVNKIYAFHGLPPHFVEEKEPEPLKEHEWWKEYLDEDER